MDIKAVTAGVIALLVVVPSQGHDIYKCDVNGATKFQEEPCDDSSVPLHLKELAAPLGTIDAKAIEGQNNRIEGTSIKERIARHQKRIRHYRKKMDAELDALSAHKDFVPDQMNAVINHYKALIEGEQFQITELRQQLIKFDK
ncbi:hypothetical protein ACH42_13530 [Endozoicomonas sp. (ex Bugula neritina AB1)]|nr:hypothetical protein ACH42_13530 [Endozoicomonas sp. (ex Bugula neritina AB1)]